jgi:hypothetical protein
MANRTKVLAIRLLLVPVISLALIARFYAGGWLLVPFGLVIYSIITALHCRFHYRAVKPAEAVGWPLVLAIVLSHLCFVAAFLLQYDYGDRPGWLTVTWLLKGMTEDPIEGSLWGKYFLVMNLFVFIPVCISWYPLKRDEEWR